MNIIIVLNYNDYLTTSEYIKKIREYSVYDKIVIVDNMSTDNSFERLSVYKNDKIHVIQTKENKGYAYGNNYGISYAKRNFHDIKNIIISNPDISIKEECVENLLEQIKKYNAFAVTPVVLDSKGKITRNYAWKHIRYGNILLSCTNALQGIMRILCGYTKFYDKRLVNKENVLQVDVLPGCYFIADFEKWEKCGGFDENTFLYYEEDIIFLKAKLKEYKSFVICNNFLIHMEGVSINNSVRKFTSRERIYRNSCVYYMKQYMQLSPILIDIYIFLNIVMLPERFLYRVIKGLVK